MDTGNKSLLVTELTPCRHAGRGRKRVPERNDVRRGVRGVHKRRYGLLRHFRPEDGKVEIDTGVELLDLLPLRVPWIALTFFAEHEKLGPMKAGEMGLSVDVQRHLVTAMKGSEVVWRYRSDGRVHTVPTVTKDTAYVASTAGTVTALNLKNGSIRWRFLAGANPEKVVVNGQLESRWPVYNTVLKDGVLYFCAGRHQEADGGIYTWAVDAKTGAVQQSFRYFAPISKSTTDRDQQRRDGVVWRGNRSIASRALMPMGLALNEAGEVCFANRFNSKGITARYDLYWQNLAHRTKDRNDEGMPDLTRPSQQLVPIDFAGWNGRTIHPVAHGPFKDVKMKFNTQKILRSRFGTGLPAE